MSSQRRHELQENELASALARLNEKIEPYSKPIAIVLVILIVGFFGWGLYSARLSDNRSDATLELLEGSATGNTELLSTVSAKYPGTAAAAWAYLYQGGEKMAAGIQSLFNSPDEAEDLLTEASVAFENALAAGDDPVLLSRAYFGLASIAESRGDAEAAIGYYESAMAAGESEAMASEAQSRIQRLSQPQTEAFLAWFEQQNFAPDDPALPPSLPDAGALPDLPDLSLPEQTGVDEDAEEAEESTEPSDDAGNAVDQQAGTEPSEMPADPESNPGSAASADSSEQAADESPSVEEPAQAEPAQAEPPEETPESPDEQTESPDEASENATAVEEEGEATADDATVDSTDSTDSADSEVVSEANTESETASTLDESSDGPAKEDSAADSDSPPTDDSEEVEQD